jgi:hypothetical protein
VLKTGKQTHRPNENPFSDELAQDCGRRIEMTMTLDLSPDVQEAITKAALEQGKTPEQEAAEALRHLYVEQNTPKQAMPNSTTDPTLALFAQWAKEDATDDPEEIARRNPEGDEFMASLRANRINFEGRTDFSKLVDGEESVAAV